MRKRHLKISLNSQLVNALNDDAEVMTKHLTQGFVDLRGQGATPQALAELSALYAGIRKSTAPYITDPARRCCPETVLYRGLSLLRRCVRKLRFNSKFMD